MEALRLLTRSTKLQKKVNSNPAGLIPSAGAPSHPQLFGESSHDDSRGTKRKRTEDAHLSELDDIPDFFANRSKGRKSEARSSQVQPHRARQGPPETYKPLSEDECKQTLRLHKIKVGILPQAIGTGYNVKHTKKSKRSKTKPTSKEKVTPICPPILRSFHELHHFGVSRRLVDNILDQGFLMPTEVQLAALPMLLGKESNNVEPRLPSRDLIDLLTVAPTGSGKTLAFLIPIMDDVLLHKHRSHEPERAATSAIILAPTHELVDQIVNEGRRLAAGTGVRISAFQKGQSIAQGLAEEDEDTSAAGYVKSDILVSTPALVGNSLSGTGDTQKELLQVRRLVLDEADVLLDPLFRDDTVKVWDACTKISLRTSLWSATMGASIESLATDRMFERYGREPNISKADVKVVRIIAGLKDSAIPNVKHQLTYAASEQGKLLALRNLLHPSTASSSSIVLRPPFLVFTQTIARAIALHSELRYDISVEAGGAARIAVLHSDLSLSARSDIMASFRKGEIWVLITTDLLSRGVDFRGVNGVVNYDIPNSSASYVHRAGRTGRAGREGGVCVTLYTKEDIPYVKSVANVIAAADKVKGTMSHNDDGGMPQWLLDALPDLSKEVRKELKEKGVAARRNAKGGKMDGSSKMRISTKSGYERKLENRRKAPRRKQGTDDMSGDDDDDDENDNGKADKRRHKALEGSDDEEFGGFDD